MNAPAIAAATAALALLCPLAPTLAAQEAEVPAPAPAEAALDGLAATIEIDGAPPATLAFTTTGSTGLQVYALSTEGRPGVIAVLGGFGRTHEKGKGPNGASGLSFLFFGYVFDDGATFFEGQILNDAMDAPPGRVDATYRVTFLGETIAAGRQAFYDQTGVTFFHGAPRFAPRQDLLDRMLAQMPDPASVSGVPRAPAASGDPDPVKSTHQTGSPRNGYASAMGAKYLFTRDAGWLARLMDFVAAQSRRPYHLSTAEGEPFFNASYPDAYFIEGKPELREYRETFGRLQMPDEKRGTDGYNGWDPEHMTVEDLYAAYVLCGSRLARRELVLIAEQLLSTPYVREQGRFQHSARAFGWTARALVRAHQATGAPQYLEGVARMIRSVDAHRIKEGAARALVPMPPARDHMPDERYESSFMVAVAASALALYCREKPDDELARELVVFCGDLLIEQGYDEESGGFYYDYSADHSGRHSASHDNVHGVSLWIPAPLCEIADFVDASARGKYLDPARRLYDINKQAGYATPGHALDNWYRFMLRAAREFDSTARGAGSR